MLADSLTMLIEMSGGMEQLLELMEMTDMTQKPSFLAKQVHTNLWPCFSWPVWLQFPYWLFWDLDQSPHIGLCPAVLMGSACAMTKSHLDDLTEVSLTEKYP